MEKKNIIIEEKTFILKKSKIYTLYKILKIN